MTTAAELRALADRVEKASGRDRELDVTIHTAIGRLVETRVDDNGCEYQALVSVPRYTTSLDAAVTLVPDGYDWAVMHTNGGLTVHAWCGSREDHFAATPALALCAATLRARAAEMEAEG